MKDVNIAINKVLCLLALHACGLGAAISSSLSSTNVESGILRRLPEPASDSAHTLILLAEKTTHEADKKWEFGATIGGAYVATESGGHYRNTPFEFNASRGNTTLTVQGDGVVSVSSQDSKSGFADATFLAQQAVPEWSSKTSQAIFIGGVTVPTRGEVGSNDFSERLLGVYAMRLSPRVNVALIAGVLRFEDDPPGKGRYGQIEGIQAKLSISPQGGRWLKIQLINAHRNGSGYSTNAELACEFTMSKTLECHVKWQRGLRKDAEDNGYGLEFKFPF